MSQVDLIELQDLILEDHIELTTPPVPRSPRPHHSPRLARRKIPEQLGQGQVVRLQGDRVILGDLLLDGTGEGHRFQPCSHAQLTCCDLCGDYIWGLYKQSLRCTYCRFTCHYRCRAFIQSDCTAYTDQSDFDDSTIVTDTNVDKDIEWGKRELSVSEVVQKVKEYNAQINSNLFMDLNRDGTYSGFIRVHLRQARSVSMAQNSKRLHISSRTRVCEVIRALLPSTREAGGHRAALYERRRQLDQVRVQRLGEADRPLVLRLCAGPSEDTLSLELREDDLGEINWDAFTLPELGNFLRILQREEEQRMKQIAQRYDRSRRGLQEALASSTPG